MTTENKDNLANASCPICDSNLIFNGIVESQVFDCPSCGTELQVLKLQPDLSYALLGFAATITRNSKDREQNAHTTPFTRDI